MLRNACLLLIFLVPLPVLAAPDNLYQQSGLPIPRYVSLKSNEVNVRVGPGKRYPITWVYTRKALPVEVVEEFGDWRKLRDYDGSEGWVHKNLLSGVRTVFVLGQRRSLYLAPDANAPTVMQADPMVIGELEECNTQWCKLEINENEGWIRRNYIWAIYPHERYKRD